MWKTRVALGFSLTICISTTGVAKLNWIFGVPPAPPTNQKSIDEIELFWSARKTFFPFILARPLPNERDSLGARGGQKKDDLFWPDLFHILGSATEFAFKMGHSASRVAKPILSKFHVNFFAIFWFFVTCQCFCCLWRDKIAKTAFFEKCPILIPKKTALFWFGGWDHEHESEESSRLFSSLTSERFGRLFVNLYFEMSLQRFCHGADPTMSPKRGDSQRELSRCDCLGETMAGWSFLDIPRWLVGAV